MFHRPLIVSGLIVSTLCGGAVASASPSYIVTDLGSLPGRYSTVARAINEKGQIVGESYGADGPRAFIYSGGAPIRDLLVSSESQSFANEINNSGQVVGQVAIPGSGRHAYLYGSDGSVKDLGTLGEGTTSAGLSINDAGTIVGGAWTDEIIFHIHAIEYRDSGPMQDLGTLGGTYSVANDINESGQIVGMAYTADGIARAYLYDDIEHMQDLGTLGGPSSIAEGINNLGQIVGGAAVNDFEFHPFLYSGSGQMQDLGILPGQSFGHAYGINDSGLVVGGSRDPDGRWHAFLYHNGAMVDLNDLLDPTKGLWFNNALDINNLGQIVGYGQDSSGQTRALLLTPVPEPSAVVHLSLAAACLIACAWRSRKNYENLGRQATSASK